MTSPFELTCQEIVELVTEYLQQDLPVAQRARFEQHLFTCPPCTTYLAQMRTLVAVAGTLDAGQPGQPAPAPTLEVFRRWKRP
jgi:anti-sigma factor RsiW